MHEPPVQVAHPNSWWVPVACDVPTMTDFILKCCVRLWTDPAGSPWQLQSTFHWLWQPRGATFGARSDNSLSWNQFGRCLSSHSFIGRCLVEATEQYDSAERHQQSNQWCHNGDDLCCSALIVFYICQLQCILRRSKQVHGSLSLSDWPGWIIAWFPPAPKWNRIWETHVTVMTMQTKRGGSVTAKCIAFYRLVLRFKFVPLWNWNALVLNYILLPNKDRWTRHTFNNARSLSSDDISVCE